MDVAEIRKTFSERIRELRGERGQNQGRFADSVGVSRGAMSYYEQGERTPDIAVLRAVCEECGVSADYLIGLMPDRDRAVSDVCLETGLLPKAARRLGKLRRIREMDLDSIAPVVERFIDDDPGEALAMAVHSGAGSMVSLLLMTDEGLELLTLLCAIIFGAELVSGEGEVSEPHLRLKTDHRHLRVEYPLRDITAALWVNVQENAAKLRDRLADPGGGHL
jgi:transcriptional regulator with XRE-family HTH domain